MSKPVPVEKKKRRIKKLFDSIVKTSHGDWERKKRSVLAGMSCTEWQDILQLEAVLKQVGTLPGKSQSNIFSHMDWKTHIAAAGSRVADNI